MLHDIITLFMSLEWKNMEFSITNHNHYDLLKISGRIDGYTSPQINKALQTLTNEGPGNIIVDMKEVTYLSSSGILVFVNTQKQLTRNKQGRIVFANVPELVFSVFELSGFDQIFEYFDDVASAANRF